MNSKIETICDQIASNVAQITSTVEFHNWQKKVTLEIDDLIVINNSVFYRDVKTNKSTKYLGLKVSSISPFRYEVQIINFPEEQRKISDYSHISNKCKLIDIKIADLSASVKEELESLGRLVFILIGEMEASEISEQSIDHPIFKKIIYDSSLDVPLKIVGENIFIKDIPDSELLWEQFKKAYEQIPTLPTPISDDLIGKFSTAVSEIRKNSFIKLLIPETCNPAKNCFLDQIIIALVKNLNEYANTLESCSNPSLDRMEYNNILRISYTFVDEIIRVVRLLISISDLKPLIFWMTAYEQFQFSYAVYYLPWDKLGTKVDLRKYVETVKSARNKAFHNLLQFNQTIDVQMGNIPIRAKKLRLFSEFTSKGNMFDYEDKELIEILTEFTRASESYVAFDFWKRNLDVMNKTLSLFVSVSKTMKLLNT